MVNKNSTKPSKTQYFFEQAVNAHQNQQWSKAEKLYLKVIARNQQYIAAHINLGALYRQKQHTVMAKQSYQHAINLDPNSIEAWFNLGNLLMTEKNWDEAQHAFQQVLQINQQHVAALSQLATIARLQGDWQHAIKELERWLIIQPGATDAYLDIGNAYRHLGQNAAALEAYQNAVKYGPDSWKTHYSLARLADQLGDSGCFAKHYRTALKLTDSPYSIHLALAQTRFDNGDINGAEEQYTLALTLKTDDFTALLGLASVLMAKGDVKTAQPIFRQLSQQDDIHLLSLLAKEIWTHKFFNESITVLKKMVQLQTDNHETHLNLAKAYSQTWQFSQAQACINRTLKLHADCTEAKDLLADIYLRQGRCDDSIKLYQQKLDRDGFNALNAASLLFSLLYSRKYSAVYKAQQHQNLMQNLLPEQTNRISFKNSKQPLRPLKIGYISADFRDQHPVGLFVTPVLQHHNHKQFSIYAYYNNRTYDESTKEISKLTDHWHEVSSWTNERLQQQIIRDGIDILVDLSGQTAKNRLGVFALRAAPVQVSWMGYPHSSGLSSIDYLMGDAVSCPPEHDHLYAEQVYRLPGYCVFCYPRHEHYPAYQAPESTTSPIVFGSFNNLTKVNDYTLQLWIKLLHAIPNARLHLKTPSFTDAKCIAQFYADFEARGINSERLSFTGPCSLDEMMHEYLQIDIGLDPIPYNGGTTTLQALWMGVPIITLAGDNFCGRMGASIMHYAGLPDWVAKSEDNYIAIAQDKASNPAALFSLKQGLRKQLRQSPLFDNSGYTRALENGYRTLWQRYCEQ